MNNPTSPRAPELQAALDKLTEAFLRWPLPESVCADLCATMHGRKDRTGTNLLSFSEARQMFTDLVVPLVEAAGKCARAEKKWDELLARLDTAEEQVRTLRTAQNKLWETVGFFASCIKSGEAWTDRCDQALSECRALAQTSETKETK